MGAGAADWTHTDGSLHTITVVIAHCMGFEPSYGGAAPAATATAMRTATNPMRVTSIRLAQ